MSHQNKRIRQGTRSRALKQRPVTFRCHWCDKLVTELRYPGPTPNYGLACKAEATRYVEAVKKARQRGTPIHQRRRTTTCWNSPTNLLTHGYIDPAAHDDDDKLQRIQAALEARHIDRADENVRRFLDECGL